RPVLIAVSHAKRRQADAQADAITHGISQKGRLAVSSGRSRMLDFPQCNTNADAWIGSSLDGSGADSGAVHGLQCRNDSDGLLREIRKNRTHFCSCRKDLSIRLVAFFVTQESGAPFASSASILSASVVPMISST